MVGGTQGAALLDDEDAIIVEELALAVEAAPLPAVDVLPEAWLDPALVPPAEPAGWTDPPELGAPPD